MSYRVWVRIFGSSGCSFSVIHIRDGCAWTSKERGRQGWARSDGPLTSMSWRALFIAASCCICLTIAVLGSEEAPTESFNESMVANGGGVVKSRCREVVERVQSVIRPNETIDEFRPWIDLSLMELCSSNTSSQPNICQGLRADNGAERRETFPRKSFLKHGLVFVACDRLLRIPYVSLSSIFSPA